MIKFLTSVKVIGPIIYIIIGITIYFIISGIINKVLKINNNPNTGKEKRKNTIISLIKNIIKYLIAILVILSILNIYGINTNKIIASLGVAAIVIGLAFQDIVKDLLAGISIIFDNQYTIGDIVEINGFKGEVIALGLKTTKIKAYTGEVKILSNSSFNEVINYNLSKFKLVIPLSVSYNTDIDLLENVLESLREDVLKIKDVKDNYQLLGIDEFANSSIIYKVVIECNPMTQLSIKRAYLKLVKEAFTKNKIEIPYNQLDIKIKNNNL